MILQMKSLATVLFITENHLPLDLFTKMVMDEGQEFIIWNYFDESGKLTLSLEQWDEDAYDASVGEVVEEYQFSSILPVA